MTYRPEVTTMMPKVRKRTRALSSALALAIAVCACGGSSSTFEGTAGDGGSDAAANGDGASAGGGAGPDASATDGSGDIDSGLTCSPSDAGAFPTFNGACADSTACEIGFHLPQCCGVYDAIGVSHGAKANFDKAEQTWESGCTGCACAGGTNSDRATADDGKTGTKGSVLVKCDQLTGALTGKCVTYIP